MYFCDLGWRANQRTGAEQINWNGLYKLIAVVTMDLNIFALLLVYYLCFACSLKVSIIQSQVEEIWLCVFIVSAKYKAKHNLQLQSQFYKHVVSADSAKLSLTRQNQRVNWLIRELTVT